MKQLAICMKYELRKLLISDKGWLIILAALLFQIVLCLTAKPHLQQYNFDTELYQQTVSEYTGAYRAETERRIQSSMDAAQARISAYSRRPLNGSDNLLERSRQLAFAQEDAAVLQAISQKYAVYKDIQDLHPELTYDLELIDYLRRFGVNWSSLICIALLMPMLMLRDSSCGMAQILDASYIGMRKILQSKLLTAAFISIGVTLLCTLLQFTMFALRWDFGTLTVPLQSITGYETCGLHCSVMGGLLIAEVIRLLTMWAVAWEICLLAKLLRREIATIAVFAILIGVGTLCTSFSLYGSLSGIENLKHLGAINICFISLLIMIRCILFEQIMVSQAKIPIRSEK